MQAVSTETLTQLACQDCSLDLTIIPYTRRHLLWTW